MSLSCCCFAYNGACGMTDLEGEKVKFMCDRRCAATKMQVEGIQRILLSRISMMNGEVIRCLRVVEVLQNENL